MGSRCVHLLLPSLLLAASPAAMGGPLLLTAGAQCRPATSADVPKLDYRDGSATNVAAAPGTTAQNATVTCSLPPVPPAHRLTRASIYYFDPDRRWSKCYFHSALPWIASRSVLAASSPTNPDIGIATLPVDATFVPHAVRCTVKPGQTLYAVETEVEPF